MLAVMAMEERKGTKRPLQLDLNARLQSKVGDAPAELVVEPASNTATSTSQSQIIWTAFSLGEDVELMDDHNIVEAIRCKKRSLETTGHRLADKGEKLQVNIKRFEEELERRKKRRIEKEADESENPIQATCSSAEPSAEFLKGGDTPVELVVEPASNTATSTSQQQNNWTTGFNRQFSPADGSMDDECLVEAIRSKKRTLEANRPFLPDKGEKLQVCVKLLEEELERRKTRRIEKGEPIVLDVENESHPLEKMEQEDKFAECLKEAKIYYPSRGDAESIEICYTDIECLAPERYLTCTIMNFYILSVNVQQSERQTFFLTLRRWWKGVNIFQKAYLLIPIHEDLHWSLVIICIPDKNDESSLTILHLDSLGFHSSTSDSYNIRSYLDRDCLSSDIPIAHRIWNNLPRRIDAKIAAVPQQKNDYDCGVFVLYFIERFLEDAPQRLKKQVWQEVVQT
ncbi:hypothetical protein L6164_027237 [Bauhinia variegata]|uniref:Uncharacterized protein n=1 Tax=Bauhinia variegata TaxID=167791 RepID=A0ACB9LU04_BAUVA|nr:hypothetical protein L6164_027237 [Bauhinia variegata]